MPKTDLPNVFSHWHKPYDDFSASTLDFYKSVEIALDRREIPNLETRRIDVAEGGFGSAQREYLRVTWRQLSFDLCAAPFGTGYFFSWWLIAKPKTHRLFYVFLGLALLGAVVAYLPFPRWVFELNRDLYYRRSLISIILLVPLGIWVVLWLAGQAFGRFMQSVPFLAAIYERFARPMTYYRVDTTLMFQSLVQAAVNESIDGLMKTKGLRALSDDEKKPVMRDFFKR